jgi:hypothetical protein
MSTKIIEIQLPEYKINKKPNYLKLGKRVDKIIEQNFPDGKYILRAVSSDCHPSLTISELINTILKTGTDKYDPKRKAVCHDEFCGYDYDIQAGTFTIKDKRIVITKDYKYPTEFGDTIWHFYEHALLDRGHPVRIDLLLIYEIKQLSKAKKFHPKARGVRRGLNNYLYKFKHQKNKKAALLGIVKILK